MPVYLDYNASAPTRPEVVAAMVPHFHDLHGNPSSTHFYGQRARAAVETARQQLAELLGAMTEEEILFTSGGTESDNMVLAAFARSGKGDIAFSAIEHPAVTNMATTLAKAGTNIHELPVDTNGQLKLDQLEKCLTNHSVALVSVMAANNETGVLQPLAEIIELCHEHGAVVHTDAAQIIGKGHFSLADTPVDFATLAGHKMGAPLGIGALYIRNGLSLERFFEGGSQETNRRPGTESVPLIVGLGTAAQILSQVGSKEMDKITALRNHLESALKDSLDSIQINGEQAPRLSNTSSVSVEGISAEMLVIRMDLEGYAISSGSACHSGRTEPSRILKAMGLSDEAAASAVRISLGPETSAEDIDGFTKAFIRVVNELRNNDISSED